ncbi:hypothetical protein CSB11_00140 [Candidatus Campbellbacteria bacterium]|nr:MAG: hypothetical protein CSB11_00140 [Candidatus Campbellbacteria bacterium]
MFLKNIKNIDWVSFVSATIISIMGLSVIYSFSGDNSLFQKQLISLCISILFYFLISNINIYFLKHSRFITFLYIFSVGLLLLVFVIGTAFSGAQSWFSLGFFAFQPTDLAKIILVFVLAKYFYKRYVEIENISHLLISGVYSLIIFILLALQPDFGSAMIVFFIWLGFIVFAGVPKRYIFSLFALGLVVFVLAFNFFFADYQKQRIKTFFNPTADVLGSGYNIVQSNIALGSGQVFGKGISYGTQNRLDFLPQENTDFIYSAIGEEWGFVGILVLYVLFLTIFLRLILVAKNGRTNFESLLVFGIALYFFVHFFVHIGINLGFMPVTGTTLPFASYGGSHLLIEFGVLGLVNAISKTNRKIRKDKISAIDIIS